MLLSRQQNAWQNCGITTENRCFENVSQFRYLGTTITDQNLIQEEIKRRLNSDKGGLRKLHNEELHNLYSSTSITRTIKSRRMRWAGHVARMGRSSQRIFMRKPEGKRPLGRPRSMYVYNIKMDLRDI
jgi:hypothetical protein